MSSQPGKAGISKFKFQIQTAGLESNKTYRKQARFWMDAYDKES